MFSREVQTAIFNAFVALLLAIALFHRHPGGVKKFLHCHEGRRHRFSFLRVSGRLLETD